MGRKISRRTFVNGSIRLALVTPLIQLEPLDAAAQTVRIGGAERRTLRTAADVIIPAQGRMPAASRVGAVGYIERIANGDRALGGLLVAGLRAMGAHAESAHGLRFDRLGAEQQVSVVAFAEKSNTPAGFFPLLRDLVYEAYYTQSRVQKLLGYNFRSGRRRTAPLEPFDEQLVARVRGLKPFYRQVPS